MDFKKLNKLLRAILINMIEMTCLTLYHKIIFRINGKY